MTTLTIHEAAETTGWSARMLRYVEQLGLVEPPRSSAGYRLYGPAQLQRLRTLRELLETHGLELGDVGFALRLRREPDLAAALDAWFAAEPRRPAAVADGPGADADWLAFEQAKAQALHEHLLAPTTTHRTRPHGTASAATVPLGTMPHETTESA